MKKASVLFLLMLPITFLSYDSSAQQSKQIVNQEVQLIQFHLEHRCVTCLKIERLARGTVQKYFPAISFVLVNVEDKKNAQKAEDFQASGSALFLYNSKTGKKKDLTAFAFMKAGDVDKFEKELKKFIDDFLKG
jgi:hypothetical protein